MTTKPTTPTPAELRELLAQEANRWGAAHVDALALRLAAMGVGQLHGGRNEALWTDVIVLAEKLGQLAKVCEQAQAVLSERLAALGADVGDKSAEKLH